jgi:hypothetical protein
MKPMLSLRKVKDVARQGRPVTVKNNNIVKNKKYRDAIGSDNNLL